MNKVIHIHNPTEFDQQFSKKGKLIIVDFSASWCGPCKMIAPHYNKLSNKYPNASFLHVDVDELKQIATKYGVKSMPTFQFFIDGEKLDEFSGASAEKLEETIKKHYSRSSAFSGSGQRLGGSSSTKTTEQNQTNNNSMNTINDLFLKELIGMGFPRGRCSLALEKTNNRSVNDAIDWLVQNPEEIKEEKTKEKEEKIIEEKETKEEEKEEEKETEKIIEEKETEEEEKEKEKEKETEKIIEEKETKEEKEEKKEKKEKKPKKELTKEEKRKRLQEKIARMKKEKERSEKLISKEGELERIKQSKIVQEEREKQKKLQRKLILDEKKRERKKLKLQKMRIRMKIKQDKLNRKKKFGGEVEEKKVQKTTTQTKGSNSHADLTQIRIKFKFETGDSKIETFKPDATIGDVFESLYNSTGFYNLSLKEPIPPRNTYTRSDSAKTLVSCNLCPTALLVVDKI